MTGFYVPERGFDPPFRRATAADITDEMVERARLIQGRLALGGPYLDTQDPEKIGTVLFYAVPAEQMRAALEAVLG